MNSRPVAPTEFAWAASTQRCTRPGISLPPNYGTSTLTIAATNCGAAPGDVYCPHAVAFDELGLGEGERIAILSPNAGRFLVALYGIPAHGRVLVPINYRLSRELETA